jgi:hypothetical protein
MILNCLEQVVQATESNTNQFLSIDDVLKQTNDKKPKRGWRK